jgi:hypothetical protein
MPVCAGTKYPKQKLNGSIWRILYQEIPPASFTFAEQRILCRRTDNRIIPLPDRFATFLKTYLKTYLAGRTGGEYVLAPGAEQVPV